MKDLKNAVIEGNFLKLKKIRENTLGFNFSYSPGDHRLGGGSGQDVRGPARQADHLRRQGVRRQGRPRLHPPQLHPRLRRGAHQGQLREKNNKVGLGRDDVYKHIYNARRHL